MESNIILFTAQWFTIQPDLFGRIEDEAGELVNSPHLTTFKRITLTLHMCDMINEERLDTRKYVYSIKTAA